MTIWTMSESARPQRQSWPLDSRYFLNTENLAEVQGVPHKEQKKENELPNAAAYTQTHFRLKDNKSMLYIHSYIHIYIYTYHYIIHIIYNNIYI